MYPAPDVTYDPETLHLLQTTFDDTWTAWLARQQVPLEGTVVEAARRQIAASIMQSAAVGERDPLVLKACALGTCANPARVA